MNVALARRAARGRTAEPVGAGEALMRGMRRSYTDETREAVVRDCAAGLKVPGELEPWPSGLVALTGPRAR